MYLRLYEFLGKYDILYNLRFGFRSSLSTNHALVSITEKKRNSIDKGDFSCGVFIDLQKAFDTVDHRILLKKLEHYGIRGVTNNLFNSYLSNRLQCVSINGSDSSYLPLTCGVPQGSILGPLLFLIYINDINVCIKNSLVHNFADDTNILFSGSNYKEVAKNINEDLNLLCHWLRASKLSLNVKKTEFTIFSAPNAMISNDILNHKIKIDGKKLYQSNHIKYLGLYLDNRLDWKYHMMTLKNKLHRAIGILAKLRHYVPKTTTKLIYYALFSSQMIYGCLIWGQRKQCQTEIEKIQNCALRRMTFSNSECDIDALFSDLKIVKFKDIVTLQNILLMYRINNDELPALKDFFQHIPHDHGTRSQTLNLFEKPHVNSVMYGINSISYQAITSWNETLRKNPAFAELRYKPLKTAITKSFLLSYC